MDERSTSLTTDPIVVTLSSIALGACAGGAVLTASTFIVRVIQAGQPDQANPTTAAVLTVGVIVGVVTAITTAFRSSRAIDNLWRRSVTGAIAMFGTALVSLIAMPFEMVGGQPGLVSLTILLVAGAVYAHRTARRASATR